MSPLSRILSLAIVPIFALLVLRFFQDELQPYIAGTALTAIFPGTSLAPSETPIFITAISRWSHLSKIASVAIELAALGYPITLITGKVYEEYVSSLHPNIKFSAWIEDEKLTQEHLQTWMSMPPGEDAELFITKKFLVDIIPEQHETMQVQLRNFREKYGDSKPTIVLFDMVVTGHYPVMMGAPGIRPDASIAISTAPLVLDSNDTFPFRTGKLPHTGPNSKAVHWEAHQKEAETRYNKEINEYWWAKLQDMGATQHSKPNIYHAMNAVPEHVLTQGIPQFEFPRSDARTDIVYYGAFKTVGKAEDKDQSLPEWWDDIAKAKKDGKKIIALSQGTVEVDPEELILPTLEALKDRKDVLVIASFVAREPSEVPNLVVPENARVTKFVPYDLLLPLTDLMITNGGYGAVSHALRLGVPMVVSGVSQDKATVCALVQWTGVGINLAARKPGAEKIGEAVQKIFTNDSYSKTVKTLSKEYEKYDVGAAFDKKIKDVVREWKRKKSTEKK